MRVSSERSHENPCGFSFFHFALIQAVPCDRLINMGESNKKQKQVAGVSIMLDLYGELKSQLSKL